MKRFLPLVFSVILGGAAHATDARFFNAGTITNAIAIDATVFENWGTFDAIFSPELPYSTRGTRYFTNRGSMTGSVGFQFDTVDPSSTPPRRPLASFFNANGATISAVDNGFSFFGVSRGNGVFLGSSSGTASFVKVAATNLVNHGNLAVGTVGLMQLTGSTVDLSRGSTTAGVASNGGDTNFFGNDVTRGFTLGGLYVNAYGVEDIYWGAGPATINVNDGTFGYNPPNGVYTPEHFVQERASVGGIGTVIGFLQSLPTTLASFEAFANVNQVGTNVSVQVVFLKTNFTDTNISAAVRFGNSSIPAGQVRNRFGRTAMVEFSTPEFDPVSGQAITNSLYFLDSSGEQTTLVLLTNALSVNSLARPSGYEITTTTPFEWVFGQDPNTPYDPSLLSTGDTYEEKENIDGFYGAYAAKVGRNPETLNGAVFNGNAFNFRFFDDTFLLFPDPTNQPGRIMIKADTLDLTLSRIRTEGLLSLDAKHLKGGGAADVSAGIINANLGSTNGSMVISNIFPSHFKRVRGDLFAWSGIWSNLETNDFGTNNVTFHVLVLDHDLKADFKPTVRDLTLKSTNLVIADDISIVRSARFETENMTISGGVTISAAAVNLRSGNLTGLKNFLVTSNGFFQGANDAYFGFDTANGLDSFTNRGTITATAPLIKANRFENSGTITAKDGGVIIVQANTANLSNGRLLAGRDVQISAGSVIGTNSSITAGQANAIGQVQLGQLTLNVTNLLTDGGRGASNFWQVSDGFVLPRKPMRGDLLGTEIRTIATGFQEAQHIWAAIDQGSGPAGYSDNVALKRLILDLRNSSSRLRFTGASQHNAIYVETLDLVVGPDVDINTSFANLIAIDDNIRIYYINSNAGDKLSTAFPGRIVQVPPFDLGKGTSAIVVRANGLGIVSPNLNGKDLEVGANYKMRATAGAGSVFAGWSGSVESSSSTLEFTMNRNMIVEANFIQNPFDAARGVYNGLYVDPDGVQKESSGLITFSVSKRGRITGRVISDKAYRFSGVVDISGHAIIPVSRRGNNSLTIDLQLDLANNPNVVTGTVTDGDWTANFTGGKGGAGTAPAGKYTLAFGGNDSGDGVAAAIVDRNGRIRVKGILADGTKFSQQVSAYGNGQWPFYTPLYRGSGCIVSLISFMDGNPITLTGDATWIKTSEPGPFSQRLTIIGSAYTQPERGSAALSSSSSVLTLSGGNLGGAVTGSASLSGNKISSTAMDRFNVSIQASTGLLKGSFVHPDTNAKTALKGVVLQAQDRARGFFLDAGQSGSVLIQAN